MSRYRSVPSCLALAALALVSGVRTAGAQAPVYAASAPTPTDSTLDVALVREIEAARTRGIPAEPLFAKIREGRLKRAPLPRIRTAVAALTARLDTARAALGVGSTKDELTAGADALAAGAGADALRTVRTAALGKPVTAALGALAQLVASGVPASRAVSMIVELLHRNATPAQVLAFGNSVESDAAGGVPAEESALFRLHGIVPSSGVGAAADAPLPAAGFENLSSGTRPGVTRAPKRRP
jgi:hypothetical protein